MSEHDEPIRGYGVYHPEAAGYPGYNDAMAAWHHEVQALQPRAQQIAEEQAAQRDREALVFGQTTAADVEREAALAMPEAPQEPEEAPAEAEHAEETEEPTEASEEPAEGSQESFDPDDHTSPEVLGHLRSVGEDEARRVLAAERAGKARKGILNLEQEILDQARKNDEPQSSDSGA